MENLIRVLHKIGDRINFISRGVLGAMSLALCCAVIGQLILRWFGTSLSWASEFSCYIFVWTTMLGSAVASRHLLHIGVDMIVNCFHGTPKKILLILANVVLLVALALFIVSSGQYTLSQMDHSMTTMKLSLGWFYCSLPISGVIMAYYTFVQLLETIYYGEAKKLPLPGDEEEEASV
jgi:TRAP-type C4-dicarboxylate transport system permease small subunit